MGYKEELEEMMDFLKAGLDRSGQFTDSLKITDSEIRTIKRPELGGLACVVMGLTRSTPQKTEQRIRSLNAQGILVAPVMYKAGFAYKEGEFYSSDFFTQTFNKKRMPLHRKESIQQYSLEERENMLMLKDTEIFFEEEGELFYFQPAREERSSNNTPIPIPPTLEEIKFLKKKVKAKYINSRNKRMFPDNKDLIRRRFHESTNLYNLFTITEGEKPGFARFEITEEYIPPIPPKPTQGTFF